VFFAERLDIAELVAYLVALRHQGEVEPEAGAVGAADAAALPSADTTRRTRMDTARLMRNLSWSKLWPDRTPVDARGQG
jgi:hypothetical protein